MWMHICQGLILAGWTLRLLGNVTVAVTGRKRSEPSGALGVFVALVWSFFAGVIAWKAGAVSTILGTP